MATTNPSPTTTINSISRRYESLTTVRTKALKSGKGAWYWPHLEPILVPHNTDDNNNNPKAVKLKCVFCNSVFSASNPSRTATEHLRRGTCPNFTSISHPDLLLGRYGHCSSDSERVCVDNSVALVESTRFCGELGQEKEDLGLLESSVRKFKVPKTIPGQCSSSFTDQVRVHNSVAVVGSSRFCSELWQKKKEDLGGNSARKFKSKRQVPGPALSKDQIECAFDFLEDWVYESCGSVSSFEHEKFRAFLTQVGLPEVNSRDILCSRLETKFEVAKVEAEARIRDAMFFQIACEGFRNNKCNSSWSEVEDNFVNFTVNLPNGTSVFQKSVFMSGGGGTVPSNYLEEILCEAITSTCGGCVKRCVGIVADKYTTKAMEKLDIENHWMVNVSCLVEGLISLIKDFTKELPLFAKVADNCFKLANFINSSSQTRSIFLKLQLQELGHAGLLRVPTPKCDYHKNFSYVCTMLEEILSNVRVLQMVVMNNSYKMICVEDPVAIEIAQMVHHVGFWNELEAVRSLVKIVRDMTSEIEAERPLISLCLHLWEELRVKVKTWCAKFNIPQDIIENIIEKRFKKSYHPAWSAAYILDPMHLRKDTNGKKYIPPFKYLTHEQEIDVDKLITRLVSEDEAPVVIMELMKWRSEGLDPLYAQAVQLKKQDPVTGKMKMANPQSSRLVWETCLSGYKLLGKVAVRLIFLHATSCGFRMNRSFMKRFGMQENSRVSQEQAQKMIFIAAHAKLERRVLSSDEEKDGVMLSNDNDDMLNEVFAEATSV